MESESPQGNALETERGRQAESPWQMPRLAWRDILWRTWSEASNDSIGLIAAGVAFYGFLAFVPMLASLVLTYGLLADPSTVSGHLQVIFDLMPADAAHLVAEQMISVTKTAAEKTGLGLALALALAIYGVMSGASALITALNVAYDETETRSLWRTYLLALMIAVSMVGVAILFVLAVGALAFLEGLIPGAPPMLVTLIRIAFWAAAALAASSVVAAVYRYAPNRRRAKWRWLTPGSLLATVGWLVTTLGFGLYAANFANYNATYGALGAVVVMLMWLYLSAYILLLGAELNSEIEHQTEVDSTVGAPRAMGDRRAHVADTVGHVP